jgi:uncharacterized HAD superfamily protein
LIAVLDIDGTLADFQGPVCRQIERWYGVPFAIDDWTSFDIEKARPDLVGVGDLVLQMAHDTWLLYHLQVIDDSLEGVQLLAEKADIYYVSARPVETEEITLQWLMDKGFPPGQMELGCYRKDVLCGTIGADVAVEDSLSHAQEMAQAGTYVYLLDRPWNQKKTLCPDVQRVRNWRQIINILEEC